MKNGPEAHVEAVRCILMTNWEAKTEIPAYMNQAAEMKRSLLISNFSSEERGILEADYFSAGWAQFFCLVLCSCADG